MVGELFKGSPGYLHRFRLVDDERVVFSDHLEVHTLELGKFRHSAEAVETSLERWSFFMKHAEELDADALPESLNEPEIHRAVEVLSMISQSEQDRINYEAREKRRRDQINRDDMIREGGRDEGLLEGRQEGIAKGTIIGRIQALQDVLGDAVLSTDDLASRTPDDLTRLLEDCRRRVRERNGQ